MKTPWRMVLMKSKRISNKKHSNSREVGQTVHNGLHSNDLTKFDFLFREKKTLANQLKLKFSLLVFLVNSHWRKQKETANLLMILPQVHLRKPCYDFCFL